MLEIIYPTINNQTVNASTTLPGYMVYLFNLFIGAGFFIIFISLMVAGAMYLLSPAKPDLMAEAKDRAGGAISGLLILTLTYLIITTINPQLNIFNFNKLPANPPPPAPKTPSGVSFYNGKDCPSDEKVQPSASDVVKLGKLVNSVGIVPDSDNGIPYMAILYDNANFQGKCQVLQPQQCQNVDSFAVSASVLQYDSSPNGDGVYFYRKPCFNKINKPFYSVGDIVSYCNNQQTGWIKISNAQIPYNGDLNQLKFTGSVSSGDCNVPKDEQDCVKYDENGDCDKNGRQCPSLGGENVSSIIINGSYVVLFVYKSPQDSDKGPWTSCAIYPASDDTNKIGPQQIKWENIRNSNGVVPNYVAIIPVKQR